MGVREEVGEAPAECNRVEDGVFGDVEPAGKTKHKTSKSEGTPELEM